MTLPIPLAPAPILAYGAALLALSAGRFKAYSLDADTDSVDAVARYLWNMQIASALWPALHLTEVTFRNTIFRYGERTTQGQKFVYLHGIQCWLDAALPGRGPGQPPESILARNEAEEVAQAIVRLGKNPLRRTPGHLVSRLGFGFWVRCCNRPYEDGNKRGPQLWKAAVAGFPNAPQRQRSRVGIRIAFDELREFRNDLAHHQPVWDRDPLKWNDRVIELLGWMNKGMSTAAKHCSTVEEIVRSGHVVHRPLAASLVRI